MQNHSGIGVKTLDLDLHSCYNIDFAYLDSWLRVAVIPGIEELLLTAPLPIISLYNFPCSLLSNGSENSIQYLHLGDCALRPTAGLGCLRSLTRLHMFYVQITGDELWCLLSNSPALVDLKLKHCDEIFSLKIPSLLQRLRFLNVIDCDKLQVVKSNAPNLSTFDFYGFIGQISLGDSLQVKTLRMICYHQANIVYVQRNLLSIAPNVETLTILSLNEMVNTPMLSGKFLHLKLLQISLKRMIFSEEAYDYFSLVSFLDASPCLENFVLAIYQKRMGHASILGESSPDLRQIPEQHHDKLKSVTITGFCSAKSLVELTCHILKNTTSLDCITLDTTRHGCCSFMKRS